MLTNDAVADIKAAQGIYRAADVARAYNVHRSTIKRIWDGQVHRNVCASGDFPDIVARPKREDLAEDLYTLLQRGRSVEEAARELNISRTAAYQIKGIFL